MVCEDCKRLLKEVEPIPFNRKINCLKGTGNKNASLMIVETGPSAIDCTKRRAYSDDRALIFRRGYLDSANLRWSQVYCTYAVKCRTLKVDKNSGNFMDRKATPIELRNCRKHLIKEIGEVQPKVIVALGMVAWKMLTGLGDFGKWEEKKVWSKEFSCWIWPLYNIPHILHIFDVAVKRRQIASFEKAATLSQTILKKSEGLQQAHVDTVKKWSAIYGMIKNVSKDKEGKSTCVIDIETKYLYVDTEDCYKGLLGIAFSWKKGCGAYVPIKIIMHKSNLLKSIMEDRTIEKIMHNCSFDQSHLRELGFTCKDSFVWDTMLMSHMCDENRGSHGLKNLAWELTTWGGYDDELDQFKKQQSAMLKRQGKEFHYGLIDEKVLSKYACFDAVTTREIFYIFHDQMLKEKTLGLYKVITAPTRQLLNEMQTTGILIDKAYVRKRGVLCDEIKMSMEQKLKRLVRRNGAEEFNPASSKQSINLLYNVLHLPKQVNKITKNLSADKYALKVLKQYHFVPFLLEAYHTLAKYKGTYIEGFLERLDENNRVHTSFLSHGTVTGRLSSRNPAVQNIPKDPDIRTMITAPKGFSIIEADYGQAELRWLAHYSQDRFLVNAFNGDARDEEGKLLDIHRLTASEVEGVSYSEITKQQRYSAKSVNFGLIYGRQAASLAMQIGTTVKEAELYIKKYFLKLQGVETFIAETKAKAIRNGYVRNLFGRIRRFPFLKNTEDKVEIEHMLRQVVNSLIQGSAADNTFIGLLKVSNFIKKNRLQSRIILTVHDSMVLEVHNSEVRLLSKKIKELMEKPIKGMTVRMIADIEIGKRWGMIRDEDREDSDMLKTTVVTLQEEYRKQKKRKR